MSHCLFSITQRLQQNHRLLVAPSRSSSSFKIFSFSATVMSHKPVRPEHIYYARHNNKYLSIKRTIRFVTVPCSHRLWMLYTSSTWQLTVLSWNKKIRLTTSVNLKKWTLEHKRHNKIQTVVGSVCLLLQLSVCVCVCVCVCVRDFTQTLNKQRQRCVTLSSPPIALRCWQHLIPLALCLWIKSLCFDSDWTRINIWLMSGCAVLHIYFVVSSLWLHGWTVDTCPAVCQQHVKP